MIGGEALTLDVEAAEERRPEKLGLELGDDATGRDDGVEVRIFLASFAINGPTAGLTTE